MARLAGSPYVLDYHDLEHPNRPVFVANTPEGERFDTASLEQVAPGGQIEWLWPGIVPLRRVTLIEGPAGSGKSQLALDLAARASRSAAWPNGEPSSLPQADVLVVCRRDEAEIVSARFERAGGDLPKLFHFREFETYLPDGDRRGSRPIALPYDFLALEQVVENNAFGVIIIDSLADFCTTPKLFSEALVQLEDLARRANVALLVTIPANTRVDAQGRLRATSRWPTESVRSAKCLVHDPDDPWRRMFVAKRTNYCREPDGLAFRLADGGVAWEAASRINPVDPLGQWSASELCLKELLKADDLPASTVFRLGGELGFTPKILRAAGKRLGVTSTRIGFSGKGHWSWSLPGSRGNAEVTCVEVAEPSERYRALKTDVELHDAASDWRVPRNLLMERELLAQQTEWSEGRSQPGKRCERMIVEQLVDPEAQSDGAGDLPSAATGDVRRTTTQLRESALSEMPAAGADLATAPAATEVGAGDSRESSDWERDHAEARRLKRKARRKRKKERRHARAQAS